jgi:hypothetical protein
LSSAHPSSLIPSRRELIDASVIGMRAYRDGEITQAKVNACIDRVLPDVERFALAAEAEMN